MSILSDVERQKRREAARRYRERHPDRVKESRRRNWEKKHPGAKRYGILTEEEKRNKKLESSRKNYANKKQWYSAWHRQNYQKNKDSILTRNKAWAAANPDRIRVLSLAGTNRRRVRQLNCDGSHTKEEWAALKEKFGHRCVACGEQKKLSKDHIVPLIRGGSDYIENIQPLCRECNSSKRDKIINYLAA